MKYEEAKKQFQQALDNQKTISILKLKRLMQIMDMGLEPSNDVEIQYLKNEIRKLTKKYKNLKRRV